MAVDESVEPAGSIAGRRWQSRGHSTSLAIGAAAVALGGLFGGAPHAGAVERDATVFSDGFEASPVCRWREISPAPPDCGDSASGACETDCREAERECQWRSCLGDRCEVAHAPSGTPLDEQPAGDCRLRVCDGGGGIATIDDDGDPPNDHDPTTVDLCSGGRAIYLTVGRSAFPGGLLAAGTEVPDSPSTTLLVTTVTDELNADGDCSLREAVRAANTNLAVDACGAGSGADTIVLQSSVTYNLARVGTDDTAINGDLDLTESVTIVGNGAVIDANGATTLDRVIQVLSGVSATLSDLTLRDGRTASFGAGIRSAGSLTLRRVTVTQNQSNGNAGGGIATEAGTLTLVDSTVSSNTASTLGGGLALLGGTATLDHAVVSGNTAGSDRGGGLWVGSNATAILVNSAVASNLADTDGGGIYNENQLTLLGCSVNSNQAGSPGGGVGGGIYNLDTLAIAFSTVRDNAADDSAGVVNVGGLLDIRNSTIRHNTAIIGGGLRNTSAGIARLSNTTVSSNTATASAGGIANGGGAQLQLSSVTVAFNVADSDANGSGDGGGLANSATVTARNSLIGENSDGSTSGNIFPDCSGSLASDGYNLIENTTGCAIAGNTTGNVTGLDPNLAGVLNNGGPTFTNAFPVGSPPHEAGNPAGCVDHAGSALPHDQRDVSRAGARCDIGAFELFGKRFFEGHFESGNLGAWAAWRP